MCQVCAKRGVAKKQTFSFTHKKRVVKKANDYPAIIRRFSTELCRFLCISSYSAQEIANRCANVIVNAQSGNKFRWIIATCATISGAKSHRKTGEDAGKISAKKPPIDWQLSWGDLQLLYQHRPEPPLRARLRGVDVGGNPPVNQRDRVKDKDRNQTKAPSCGALVLYPSPVSNSSIIFQQSRPSPLLTKLIAWVTQRTITA